MPTSGSQTWVAIAVGEARRENPHSQKKFPKFKVSLRKEVVESPLSTWIMVYIYYIGKTAMLSHGVSVCEMTGYCVCVWYYGMESTVPDNFKYSMILLIVIDISMINSYFSGMHHY